MITRDCLCGGKAIDCKTRMHSSRKRTGRSLTVFRSLQPGGGGVPGPGGGVYLVPGGVYLVGGGVYLVRGGVPGPGGGGCTWSRGGGGCTWSRGGGVLYLVLGG